MPKIGISAGYCDSARTPQTQGQTLGPGTRLHAILGRGVVWTAHPTTGVSGMMFLSRASEHIGKTHDGPGERFLGGALPRPSRFHLGWGLPNETARRSREWAFT